jgi:hypothetical protein
MLQEPSNNRWKRIPSNRESIDSSGPGIRAGCIRAAVAVAVPPRRAARNRQCHRYRTQRCHSCPGRTKRCPGRTKRCPGRTKQVPAGDAFAAGWPRVVLPAPAVATAHWTMRDWLAPDLKSVVAPPFDPHSVAALRLDPHSVAALRLDPHSAVALPFDLYFVVAQPIG